MYAFIVMKPMLSPRLFLLAGLALSLAAATGCATRRPAPPAGIVAWWPGQGNAQDVAGTNNGVLAPDVCFGPGVIGKAFYLADTKAYITVPASPSLDIGSRGTGLTIETWICSSNVEPYQPICEWNQGFARGNIGAHLWLSPDPGTSGMLFANIIDTRGNSHQIRSANDVVAADRFQHVAVTYDPVSGAETLYANGKVVARQDIGTIAPETAYNFYIGRRPSDSPGDSTYGNFFDGIIDEVRLYRRALSEEEIRRIYDAGSAGKHEHP